MVAHIRGWKRGGPWRGGRISRPLMVLLAAVIFAFAFITSSAQRPQERYGSSFESASSTGISCLEDETPTFTMRRRLSMNSLRDWGARDGDARKRAAYRLYRLRGGDLEMMDLDIDDPQPTPSSKDKKAKESNKDEKASNETMSFEKLLREMRSELLPPIDKPPSNFVNGFVRGAGAAATGVLKGAITMAVYPVVGAVQGGAGGFVAGCAAGAVGASLCATAGFVNAGRYVACGVSNTPKYCSNLAMSVRPYNLTDEAMEIQLEAEERERIENRVGIADEDPANLRDFSRTASVKDTSFYDILGVPINASTETITSSYRKLAIKMHPDRFKTKPEKERRAVEAKFKKVVQAYQTLSKEDKRTKYNHRGLTEVPEQESLDLEIGVLLAIIFGGAKFTKYIGEPQPSIFGKDPMKLWKELSTNHTEEGTGLENGKPDLAGTSTDKFIQKKREVELAVNLAKVLDGYFLYGDVWIDNIKNEAEKLKESMFGEHLLHTLGTEYAHHAAQWDGMFLSRSIKRPIGRITRSTRAFRHYMTFVSGISSLVTTIAGEVNNGKDGSGSGDDEKENGEEDDAEELEGKKKKKKKKKQPSRSERVQQLLSGTSSKKKTSTKKEGTSKGGYMDIDDEGGQRKTGGGEKGGVGEADEDDDGGEMDVDMKKEIACREALLNIGWALFALDIQRTLLGVCNRVLGDTNTSKQKRLSRVKALHHLGRIWLKKGTELGSSSATVNNIDMEELNKSILAARVAKRNKELGIECEEEDVVQALKEQNNYE